MTDRICTEEACELPVKARGLCRNHYAKLQRLGLIPPKQYQNPVCTVDGCDTKSHSASMCTKHYARYRKTGSTADPTPRRRAACSVDECEGVIVGAKLCSVHYQRRRRLGTLELAQWPTECAVTGCSGRPNRAGLCLKHETRVRRHGDPEAVFGGPEGLRDRHHNWTGSAASYRAVHKRLTRDRGLASAYRCVDCGAAGAHWSYDHTCTEEQRDRFGHPYSVHPWHYVARCLACHTAFDNTRGVVGLGRTP